MNTCTNKEELYKKKLRARCIKLFKSDEGFLDVIQAVLKSYYNVEKVYDIPPLRLVEFDKQISEIEKL